MELWPGIYQQILVVVVGIHRDPQRVDDYNTQPRRRQESIQLRKQLNATLHCMSFLKSLTFSQMRTGSDNTEPGTLYSQKADCAPAADKYLPDTQGLVNNRRPNQRQLIVQCMQSCREVRTAALVISYEQFSSCGVNPYNVTRRCSTRSSMSLVRTD